MYVCVFFFSRFFFDMIGMYACKKIFLVTIYLWIMLVFFPFSLLFLYSLCFFWPDEKINECVFNDVHYFIYFSLSRKYNDYEREPTENSCIKSDNRYIRILSKYLIALLTSFFYAIRHINKRKALFILLSTQVEFVICPNKSRDNSVVPGYLLKDGIIQTSQISLDSSCTERSSLIHHFHIFIYPRVLFHNQSLYIQMSIDLKRG
jgi:hypothetical protein